MGTAKTGDVGMLGEAIATQFFKNKGYRILAQNYRKPWGEIDIVVQKGETLHFVEVKAGTASVFDLDMDGDDRYHPEENVHRKKIERLVRTTHSFLAERKPACDSWQLDVAVVLFNRETKRARVKIIPDILSG